MILIDFRQEWRRLCNMVCKKAFTISGINYKNWVMKNAERYFFAFLAVSYFVMYFVMAMVG